MTAALEFNSTSMPALARVWTLLMTQVADAGGAKEWKRVGTSDAAILADIQAATGGDGAAYARLIGRYQSEIAQRMLRFSRDPAAIEELVHDVFVEAYFSLGGFRGDAPFEHWLQKIATRVGYKYWQRRRKEPTISLGNLGHDPPAIAGSQPDADAAEEVVMLLERLPPRDRLVLTLLYLESHTVAEAAELAGWSQTMIKVQAYRARQKLRKLVGELADSEENRGGNYG